MNIVKVRKVKTPTRGTALSAGIDFYVPDDFKSVLLAPHEDVLIPTGIHVRVPAGHALVVMNKSGIATNLGLIVGACVIDEDYQGEVNMHLFNVSQAFVRIESGMKLVQMLLIPIAYNTVREYDSLQELYPQISERGTGGFGSTGHE